MKQKKIAFILLLISIISVCTGQILRPSISELVTKVSALEVLNCSPFDLKSKNPRCDDIETLCKEANDSELVFLTNNNSPIVRCYAFRCLVERRNSVWFSILKSHLTDTSSVIIMFSDLVKFKYVGDYFISILSDNSFDKSGVFPSIQQQNTIDSCFIFQEKIKLLQKNKLLESLKPEQKYYSRIRSMVTVDYNMSAAIALSKFQNKNDIELIKKLFTNSNTQYYAAYCVREFPDTVFFPLLIKMFDAQWDEKYYDYDKWRILFQALAKYPNDETIKLFKKVTETKDSFRYQTLGSYLKIAAIKYPNKLFKPFKKIKLDTFYEDQVKSQMNYE